MRNVVLSVLLLCILLPVWAQPEIVVSAPAHHPLLPLGLKITQEMYAPLGMTVRMLEVPSARSLPFVDDGNADAELARVIGMEQQFTHLRRVPLPILNLYLVVVSRSPNVTLVELEHARTGYVVIQLGGKYVEKVSEKWRPVKVNTMQQQLDLLANNRADYALIESLRPTLTLPAELADKLYQVTLEQVPLYHYVHEKHQQLIPALTENVRHMIETGRDVELITQFEQEQIAHFAAASAN